MPPILLSIGMVYLLALGAGRISASLGIPRVTGYLIIGLAAGPSVGDFLGIPTMITVEHLLTLDPVHDIIIGLIVFTIGGSFGLEAIRKNGPKLLCISAVEIGMTAILVGLATILVRAPPLSAAFLAVISITTAPAATQMVIREYQSEGPLTDTILALIGINNMVSIIAFILLRNTGLLSEASFFSATYQVLMPFALGAFIGLGIAVMEQRLIRQVDRQMLVLASVAIASGLAVLLDIFPILAVFISGVVAVNASPNGKRTLEDITAIDYPLYVLFFVLAGADLHLESLRYMGFIGIVYVVMRSTGKYFGCRIGTALAKTSKTIKIWLGPAMLAQAGLAIGLAEILAREWPGSGKTIQTIILASVVVFEVLGPLFTRISLVNAGEITVLNLLVQRSPVRYSEGLHHVCNQFKNVLGLSAAKEMKSPADIRVGHIMRRNVEVLRNDASFHDVLKALGHSRYDRLPVVNEQNELVGVIKYADIANTLFNPILQNIVLADEIATKDYLRLTPEDTMETAIAALKDHQNDTYLFVVEKNNSNKLLGVVRHNDVLYTQIRLP